MNRALVGLGLLGGLSLALTGCGGAGAPASPSDSTLATPTATASATPTAAAADPNILFTITATSTSPDGAVSHLTQVVYKPTDTATPTVMSQLDSECTGWKTGFADPDFVTSVVTATDDSPAGAAWTYDPAVVSLNGYPVFTGDFDSFQSYCASVQVKAGGTATGVTPVIAGASPDAKGGWARMEFGFGIASDPSWSHAEALAHVPHITDCHIELSADAIAASTTAVAWATFVQSDPDFGCMFGEASYFF